MAGIDSSKVYLLKGSTLSALQKGQADLWNGKNLQRGPGVRIRGAGSAGVTIASSASSSSPPSSSFSAFPWKCYDASDNTNGAHVAQIRCNSGDGFAGSIQGYVGHVNGSPITTPVGTATAPKLAISGTGVIYASVPLTSSTDPSGNTVLLVTDTINVLWTATFNGQVFYPDPSTGETPTLAFFKIADVAIKTDSGGNVSVTVDMSMNGYQQFNACGGVPIFW